MRWGKEHHKRFAEVVVFAALIVAALLFAFLRSWTSHRVPARVDYGATFSKIDAQSLNLDWRRTYIAVLDDLGVRTLRIPIYWNDVERSPGEYSWDDVDWMMDQAAQRAAKVTLVIGRKVPRWPECFVPDWAERLYPSFEDQALLDYLSAVVHRYDASPALDRWQVENEPFYDFGNCPSSDPQLFTSELKLVHDLSKKPIMLTTSGENEVWSDTAVRADVLGISLYKITWSDALGYSVYPYGPDFYAAKAAITKPLVGRIVVSELQAEPWFAKPWQQMTLAEQTAAFTADQLKQNAKLATDAGFDQIYLWGVEWWFFLHLQGEDGLWNAGKELIHNQAPL